MACVKESRIPNAEKGLFTRKKVVQGDFITFYTGMIVDPQFAKTLTGNDRKYLLHVSGTGVAGLVCKGNQNGLGFYANSIHPSINRPKVNAKYDMKKIEILSGQSLKGIKYVVGMEIKIPIVATREIKKGKEVIVNYGDSYWHTNEITEPLVQRSLAKDSRDSRSFGRNLYVAPSHYVGFNRMTQHFDYLLKEGLFCTSMIHAGASLPEFEGEIINNDEMNERFNAGRGGYFIKINDKTVLDCYESRVVKKCLSSCANSAHAKYPVRNIKTGEAGRINCKLTKCYDKKNKMWRYYYVALELIPANSELLADYRPCISNDD